MSQWDKLIGKGCLTCGNTPEEAFRNVEEAKK